MADGARIAEGAIFRCVTHSGTVWGSGISEKVVWWVVRQCAKKAAIDKLAPHDLRRTCARFAIQRVESWSKFSSCSGIAPWRPRRDILAPDSESCTRSTTRWALSRMLHRAEEVTENETLQGVHERQ
jgi:integrase